jgi:hypothetical protein
MVSYADVDGLDGLLARGQKALQDDDLPVGLGHVHKVFGPTRRPARGKKKKKKKRAHR